jgi:signal peptidase I
MNNTPLNQPTNQEPTAHAGNIPTAYPASDTLPALASDAVSWDTVDYQHTGSSLTVRSAVKELLETAVYILLVFVIVRSMVQNFKIEGTSMEPSLHSDQYILVNKLVYFHFDLNAPLRFLPGFQDQEPQVVYPLGLPKRGDIIVFEYPNNPEQDFIKRVIGIPGDTIKVQQGKVFLNGKELPEPYLIDEETMPENPTYCDPGSACHRETITVPAGTVYVMGDNRQNSSDSRKWDSLDVKHIIGKAWLLYYPLDDLQMIPHTVQDQDLDKPS